MKTRLLALIIMISLAGAAAAMNSGNFQRNHTRVNRNLTVRKSNSSELQLKKIVRNKRNLNIRWQKSVAGKNKKAAECQSSEVNKTH